MFNSVRNYLFMLFSRRVLPPKTRTFDEQSFIGGCRWAIRTMRN